jgi:MFS family permease
VSLLAGNARGLATLLSATAVADRWGTARYARLNGIFNAPLIAASALAPFLGAGLAALLGGYPAAFTALAALGLAAVLLVVQKSRGSPRSQTGGVALLEGRRGEVRLRGVRRPGGAR